MCLFSDLSASGRSGPFFDSAVLDSEDEEDILEEFMAAHSEQVLKNHTHSRHFGTFMFPSCTGFNEEMEMYPGWKRVFHKKYNACTLPEKVGYTSCLYFPQT